MINSRDLITNFFTIQDQKHNLPWDHVVITAFNAKQAGYFEAQLRAKSLSTDKISVIPDPEGVKLGNGGSTIYVLKYLRTNHEKLDDMKILIIHAGGYSKRMPSTSIKGKIFMTLATKFGPLDMLDLKLIMLAPFGERMSAGVFVTCADDLEPYEIRDHSTLRFGNDFTVFAHITDNLQVASQHGVYKIQRSGDFNSRNLECLRVLQKPTVDLLRSTNSTFEHEGKESALIDSMYSFGHKVSRCLLSWADKVDYDSSPYEVDGYGDFLQPLGREANTDYISHNDRTRERSELHFILNKLKLTVNILEKSYFVHLGTNKEYITHLTTDSNLQHDLQLSKSCNANFMNAKAMKRESYCIINSSFIGNCINIGDGSVVEYSRLSGKIDIGINCIISYCSITTEEDNCLKIPKNTAWQTVPIIKREGDTGYITFVVGVFDDMKQEVVTDVDLKTITYCGGDFQAFLQHHRVDCNDIFICEKRSVWNARLFPVSHTRELSFRKTLDVLLKNIALSDIVSSLYSISEIIEHCDISAINIFQ